MMQESVSRVHVVTKPPLSIIIARRMSQNASSCQQIKSYFESLYKVLYSFKDGFQHEIQLLCPSG